MFGDNGVKKNIYTYYAKKLYRKNNEKDLNEDIESVGAIDIND